MRLMFVPKGTRHYFCISKKIHTVYDKKNVNVYCKKENASNAKIRKKWVTGFQF